MEALQFSLKNKTLQLVKKIVPSVSDPKHVLIKVAYAGVCGTDLHIIQGEFPCEQHNPITLGHEFSGTVVDVGSQVTVFKKGDKVSVDPNSGCMSCNFCHSGQPHFCKIGAINNTIGIYRDGGWANYALAPEKQVHKLPEPITLEQAALCEPVSCITHAWDIVSPVTVGQKILIIGAGIIGNLWVCALHLQGHKKVTISEPISTRLETIRKLDTGYDLVTPDELKKKQNADPDYLFDLIIECSGFPPAIEHGVTLLARGGKLCCFGVCPPQGKISISPFEIYMKELKIYGANINPFSFPKSLGLLESMGNRYLNYEKLGIKTFPLNQYQEAIELLKKGSISKAMFQM